ncbi:MFS general substrate transporter [Eremomyces bilateralis CBS 781.70]|uniref:MFS general substrate transporter n=1 Tax=Eremomyces bilateralis CBS 781.70 TaxID=1392243 RepID=A0A6G1FSU5_9PEZI|nr:MFS general substrate transporter [Eremomyces bilateralis CBS 781.70]KAF1808752.1 MFS general substrate transporter [Eremomyces bilateralis CBS 781.70]
MSRNEAALAAMPGHDERTPLLSPTSTDSLLAQDLSSDENRIKKKPLISRFHVVFFLIASVLVVSGVADGIFDPATTRLIEDAYCRRYYRAHDSSMVGLDVQNGIPEQFCKLPAVQGDVALLRGWLMFLEAGTSLIFAPIFGWVADRYTRKWVAVLLMCSFALRSLWISTVLYFPKTIKIELIMLASMHTVLGGSSAGANSLLYTILTDVTPEQKRVATFFRLGGASMSSMLISPPIASALMKANVWTAILVGLGLYVINAVMCLLLPETLPEVSKSGHSMAPRNSDMGHETANTIPDFLKKAREKVHYMTSFVIEDSRVLLLLPPFMFHMLLMDRSLILQYTSIRFGMPLSDATLFIGIRGGFTLVYFLIVMPIIMDRIQSSTRWPRTRLSVRHSDLLLGRISAISLFFAFLATAAAPIIPLFVVALFIQALGLGITYFLRGLLTSFVGQHQLARLFTVITVVDALGLMVGSPGLAWVFEKGMSANVPGLLWLVVALGVFLTSVGMFFVSKREVEGVLDEASE